MGSILFSIAAAFACLALVVHGFILHGIHPTILYLIQVGKKYLAVAIDGDGDGDGDDD